MESTAITCHVLQWGKSWEIAIRDNLTCMVSFRGGLRSVSARKFDVLLHLCKTDKL